MPETTLKKPSDYPQIHFRPDADLLKQIEKRRRDGYSLGQTVREDLSRYYSLLAVKANELEGVFTLAEMMLMADACNGTMFEPHTAHLLRFGIQDAIDLNGVAEKWKVDGADLMEKLENLSPEGTVAIVDIIERFWAAVTRGEELPHRASTFARLGIVVKG